ncbi:MAG TPA: response regulator [Gaiellaceae bacterium]|jgi:signal transduction histidine kinase|nr:response regulator [Gaiellaceae bacterium]
MTGALKVLLLDDDEDDLLLTRDALAEAPGEYEVESVTSITSALQRAETVPYNVYLVDYRLGAESGLDFIRRACDLGRDGPFILLTGQGELGTDTEALRAGASDYLVKLDLTPETLARSIRYAVERQTIQTRIRETRKLETLGVLAAGIAHEYNNLLTAILGSVDLGRMSLGTDATATARHFSTIETAAKEAAGMTHRLLAFAGSARLDSQSLLLHDVIEESIALAHDFVGTGFAVDFKSEQLEFDADFTLVTHAVGGVLANAYEAAPLVIPQIIAKIHDLAPDELATYHDARRVSPGPFVVLTITNDGEVLSPEVLQRSFEPFYSTKFLGRGLGLAAANGTVRSHGGAMRLAARAGGGAVTTIALPARARPLHMIH